jgi:Sec-independent protein translocase protein TatA
VTHLSTTEVTNVPDAGNEANHTDLAQDLVSLAGTLDSVDSYAAQHIRDLGDAIASRQLGRWAGTDLFQAFNLESLEARIAASRVRHQHIMQWLEIIRNVLVLLPVTFTWAGLFAAAVNYRVATSPPNVPTQDSFLLLWERGFDGMGAVHLPLVHTFSQLALWDALLLVCLVIVTTVLYVWRNANEARATEPAGAFRRQAENALGRANLLLAQERYLHTERAFDHFRVHAESLIEHLTAERARSDELVDRREREANQLTVFASDLVEGTRDLPDFARQIRESYLAVQSAVAQFSERAEQIVAGQSVLEETIQKSNERTESLVHSLVQAQENLHHATDVLRSSVNQATTAAAGTVEVAQQLSHMGTDLLTDYTNLRDNLIKEQESHTTVAEKLAGTSGIMDSVARSLEASLGRFESIAENISATMYLSAQITDEYARREEQERDLIQLLERITTAIHQSIDRLSAHDENAIRLLQHLGGETERLSALWNDGYETWLKQLEDAGNRVSSTLRAQGIEIQRSGAALQESMENLQSELADALGAAVDAR